MPEPGAQHVERALSPVVDLEAREAAPSPSAGIALCLSGGGYRAMVFHVGALWRLNELGYLGKLDRVSSVSGGSITAGLLGLKWAHLGFVNGVARGFEPEVVAPIRALAGKSIDVTSVVLGALLPGSISGRVSSAYRKHLFGDATLQDLPDDPPRFVINATNVQSGALWRFSKPYMRDYLVGEVKNPNVRLADAVAASSAFPPVLSPARMQLDAALFSPSVGEPLHQDAFLSQVVLSDGGVYDNLGLETAWKRYQTILVSDAGQKIAPDANPHADWVRHAIRVLSIIDNQVRSLRKRQLIAAYEAGTRNGTYWGIGSDIAKYGVAGALPCLPENVAQLAAVPTRLAAMPPQLQERLINWGYAICDAAIRRHVDPGLPPPAGFPYPAIGI